MQIIAPKRDHKFYIFHCEDKNNEHWTPNRNMIAFPRPFRGVLIGPPNSGKSGVVKNLILSYSHPLPEFSKIFVWSKSSREWEKYADEIIDNDVDLSIFMDNEDMKNQLLVIDDVELIHVNKKLKEKISMLFKHVSSHYQLSIVVCIQEYKMVPIDLRACINVFAISLNIKDVQSISTLGSKIGLSYSDFKKLFLKLRDEYKGDTQFRYVVIDNTTGSPYPLRLDFVNQILLE